MNQHENGSQLSLQSMFVVVFAIAVPLALLRVSIFLGSLATACSIILLVAYLSRSTFGEIGWFSECLLKASLIGFVVFFVSLSITDFSDKYFPSNKQIAFKAVQANDLEQLTSVISKVDINAITISTHRGRLTLLDNAVVDSSPDVVALLLDNGADPNHQGPFRDSTPLHRVVYYRDETPDTIEIIKLLIEHGADPRITDADGKTPIDYNYAKSVGIANALHWKLDQTNE